jgi:hypothetical protein
MTARRPKRRGSRFLLGLALFGGTLWAMYAAALLSDIAMDLLGVVSVPVRLAVKALSLAAAVPAGFLLVERAFLASSSRRAREAERKEDPADR